MAEEGRHTGTPRHSLTLPCPGAAHLEGMSISRPDMPAVTFPGGCDVQLISERAKLEADAGANSAAAKASGSRKTGTQNCHMTPQPCFGGSTQRNGTQGLEQTLAPQHSQQHPSQGPRAGGGPRIQGQVDGQTNGGMCVYIRTSTQECYSALKGRKSRPRLQHG